MTKAEAKQKLEQVISDPSQPFTVKIRTLADIVSHTIDYLPDKEQDKPVHQVVSRFTQKPSE
jgi:hypothetical protein